MTDWNGLQASLASTGTLQLGLAFAALCCYAVALSGIFPARARLCAALVSVGSTGALAASIEPWTHGVILAALGMTGMGLFSAAVWALSALCGLAGGAAPRIASASAVAPLGDTLQGGQAVSAVPRRRHHPVRAT
jgi:hypothetical protein